MLAVFIYSVINATCIKQQEVDADRASQLKVAYGDATDKGPGEGELRDIFFCGCVCVLALSCQHRQHHHYLHNVIFNHGYTSQLDNNYFYNVQQHHHLGNFLVKKCLNGSMVYNFLDITLR